MMTNTISDSLVWTTEKRTVNALVPLPVNPRKLTDKQRRDLEASLVKFNLVEIPAINRDSTIIAGHQRIKILVALGRGDEEIDVRVPSRLLTDAEVMEYNIRSNVNVGEWSLESLKENFDLAELLAWGFDHDDFRELGLEIPEFSPTSVDDQPRLDQKNSVICPECGHEFTPA
jgi:ParB-like chromosome segregation protein Spo0J